MLSYDVIGEVTPQRKRREDSADLLVRVKRGKLYLVMTSQVSIQQLQHRERTEVAVRTY